MPHPLLMGGQGVAGVQLQVAHLAPGETVLHIHLLGFSGKCAQEKDHCIDPYERIQPERRVLLLHIHVIVHLLLLLLDLLPLGGEVRKAHPFKHFLLQRQWLHLLLINRVFNLCKKAQASMMSIICSCRDWQIEETSHNLILRNVA